VVPILQAHKSYVIIVASWVIKGSQAEVLQEWPYCTTTAETPERQSLQQSTLPDQKSHISLSPEKSSYKAATCKAMGAGKLEALGTHPSAPVTHTRWQIWDFQI
jgi:hypothetical protein